MKNDNARKLKKVTLYPRWMLGILGRYHAAYGGKAVVDTNIRKWTDRLAAFENEVVKAEEKLMLPIRESAAKAVSSVVRTDDELASIAADAPVSAVPTADDPRSIRSARNARSKAAAKENAAHSENAASTDEIIRINENIISMNVNLNEHIEELRNNCRICIDCYLIGVRAVMPDYVPGAALCSDTALDIYNTRHKTLDDAVQRIAYAMIASDGTEKEE